MNKKIFTLLAITVLLFSTAYSVSARSVADKSVGALVTSLPYGVGIGMYHIQVDSIYMTDAMAAAAYGPATLGAGWYPVTRHEGYSAGSYELQARFGTTTSPVDPFRLVNSVTQDGDTIVLAVTEAGEVKMVSAKDLREAFAEKSPTRTALLTDLQATMWCIEVQKTAEFGQRPTFHFMNKIFQMDLDFIREGTTYVSGRDKGWMYSLSFENGQLYNRQPFYRHEANENGKYRVITAQAINNILTGAIYTKSVEIDDFLKQEIPGMLKFSIVKISPFVLTATDFNTLLGTQDESKKVKLKFSPANPTLPTPFADYELKAHPSNNTFANRLDYLNIEAFNAAGKSVGFVANSNKWLADDDNKYENDLGYYYLKMIATSRPASNNDKGDYNYSYRFVYFPSEDSLVINAYYIQHDQHKDWKSTAYEDSGNYLPEIDPDFPYNYGLYNDTIHNWLTVILQDLNGLGNQKMLTIDHHPTNTRMNFGLSCESWYVDWWMPKKGVYTIWDTRGRALGVRIYNGSYTPQWLELEDVECPDRIPSYQWVVEPADGGLSPYRVDITNREFGDMTLEAEELVRMLNVLIRRPATKIFKNLYQFVYHPLLPTTIFGSYGTYYKPINDGYVAGVYLAPMKSASNCDTGGEGYGSGFRPVINEFLGNEYLGYKHFVVEQDQYSPNYGRSQDIGQTKGMDFNAFAFNYWSSYGDDNYITLGQRYNDQILKVAKGKANWTGFQFMLGTYLRTHGCVEELYGYPREEWGPLPIFEEEYQKYCNPDYVQWLVPVLKRYYYELKVADYYTYRDGLAEQFVVLKGAKDDGTDIANAMKYGVANIYHDKQPFKFANIYLRDTYFRPIEEYLPGEERDPADDTRRIYYVLLDRIEREQVQRVTSHGLQVSDTLYNHRDASAPYNLVTLDVNYNIEGWINARGKTGQVINPSTFALENVQYELYRRLRSLRDDNANPLGDGVDPELGALLNTNLDAPKVLRINRARGLNHFLYEDAISESAYNYGINFLGISNAAQNKEQYAPDGTIKYNYHLFIDTAFINRGTGPIKPQYLIGVDVQYYPGTVLEGPGYCDDIIEYELPPYYWGRYLVNATDSARTVGSDGDKDWPHRDDRFIYGTNWDRLVFVDAIHIDDKLYIVSELNKDINPSLYTFTATDGKTYVDGIKLALLTELGLIRERVYENSMMLGTYYDFGRWDNFHNDVCFSLRFVESGAKNPNEYGLDICSNYQKRFFIESETWNRTAYGTRKIAPTQGGWIKLQGGTYVPVLSRTSYEDAINQAEVFNIAEPSTTDWQVNNPDGQATSNENIGAVKVVAGNGNVTILNATGKQVTIANLVGQSLVNKVLAGNNEVITVSKGVAVVTVEGEKAVKVIIK